LTVPADMPGCGVMNADINQDGAADFADINPFVALLSGNPMPITCE
jgi:hypothetical protein